MKRMLTFLLAILYTVSSIGMSVTTHYCGGKARTCQCAKPKQGQQDHCCKDTVKYLKNQDTHQYQEVSSFIKRQSFDALSLPEASYSSIHLYVVATAAMRPATVDIFNSSGRHLYQLYCIYRV